MAYSWTNLFFTTFLDMACSWMNLSFTIVLDMVCSWTNLSSAAASTHPAGLY
jgi:hypothetical protein